MQKLPIGIQNFEEIRNENYLYVDKTEVIYRLVTQYKVAFLSRPRRFGKSLTLSTIQALFEGKKALFKNLWLENLWNWDKIHPVIHLTFTSIDYKNQDINSALMQALDEIAKGFEIELLAESAQTKFRELIIKTAKKLGRVVILVDEYDKPIIDYLDENKIEIAKINRESLRDFYAIINDCDKEIEFFLMTGVSKFSQIGIFSHLNHLFDISNHRNFVDIVGYTQLELDSNFVEWLDDVQKNFPNWSRNELMTQIKIWYNGYSWDALTKVYNPYSILLFLSHATFKDFWFQTGTPTFLLQLIKREALFNFNNFKTNSRLIASFDLENLDLRAILFQTGYLTIKELDLANGNCILDYPNREVEQAMSDYIIAEMTGLKVTEVATPIYQLKLAFQQNNLEKVINIVKSLLKDVPSNLLKKKQEDFYHALIHLVFKYLGLEMDSEVNTSDGRMDVIVKTNSHIYIFEFKINQNAESALKQIKEKQYFEKFSLDTRIKTIVGVAFDTQRRTIKDWKFENI